MFIILEPLSVLRVTRIGLSCGVVSENVQDTVGINVKADLDLRNSRSGKDIGELEFSEVVVVFSKSMGKGCDIFSVEILAKFFETGTGEVEES